MKRSIDPLVYNVAGANSLSSRMSLRVRRKIFNQLSRLVDLHEQRAVLDVGVTADKSHRESNYFEAWFPYKDRITALSDQDATWLEHDYPGLCFVQGDGRAMPFPDASFDLVFSSAVLEHVGSYRNQEDFLRECLPGIAASCFSDYAKPLASPGIAYRFAFSTLVAKADTPAPSQCIWPGCSGSRRNLEPSRRKIFASHVPEYRSGQLQNFFRFFSGAALQFAVAHQSRRIIWFNAGLSAR